MSKTVTKLELQQQLTIALERALKAESEVLRLKTQLEAERTVGRSNAAGASALRATSLNTLKVEYMRRTQAGESVVISGGRVVTHDELRASRVAH